MGVLSVLSSVLPVADGVALPVVDGWVRRSAAPSGPSDVDLGVLLDGVLLEGLLLEGLLVDGLPVDDERSSARGAVDRSEVRGVASSESAGAVGEPVRGDELLVVDTYSATAQPPYSGSSTKPLRVSPTDVVSPRSHTPTIGASVAGSERTFTLEVQVPVPAAAAVPAITPVAVTPATASAATAAAIRREFGFIVGHPPWRRRCSTAVESRFV
ncbi:hypothetical protein GCM10009613_57250 [Pseudonocardia kongjuensis]|uniref:Secreted protein n=1 Tax=Pseudonocardia kongjuensis TaxID=102227 RepID=A0ABN1Y9R7_9PSEU